MTMNICNVKTNILLLFLSLQFLFLVGCDNVTSPEQETQLNPSLHQVFYWGYSDAATKIPNTGPSVGPDVLFPCWIIQNQLFFYSSELRNAVSHKGFFLIEIDANDFSYKKHSFYSFESSDVTDIKNIPGTRKFLVTIRQNLNQRIVLVDINGNSLIVNTLIEDIWKPVSAAALVPGQSIVFYGTDPLDPNIHGFFKAAIQEDKVTSISLLSKISLGVDEAQSFAVSPDARHIIFGRNDISRTRVKFNQLGITAEDSTLKVIAERNGYFRSVAVNPVNQSKLLLNYRFSGDAVNPPQDHIELFDLITFKSTDLDVRTTKFSSRFIVNDNPSWSPDGRHMAFSAGAFDSEGGVYPLELWIFGNII